jgi:hypothetical protein
MRESFRRRPREEPASRGHADLATTGASLRMPAVRYQPQAYAQMLRTHSTRMIAIRDGVGICPVYRPDAART